MRWILLSIKRVKWLGWAALAGAATVLFLVTGRLFTRSKVHLKGLPKVPEKLREKVAKAEEESLIARVRAKAEADEATRRIEEISQEDDGAKRRERLAEYLRTL